MSQATPSSTDIAPVAEPDAPVLFAEHEAGGGRRIGIATLNAPRTLNGFSLEMARLLDAHLLAWAADPAIALVVLQGAGEKAFCAGGDLHALYASMRAYSEAGRSDPLDNAHAAAFFETEYRLDHRIHRYAKPILCWGHGIVMGGGIGLMAGAGHRVVSERSKLAFPEISVGLFPDVGGSWLLQRVPDRTGLFLALTGAPLNAGDAIHAGLADVHVPEASRDAVFDALRAEAWSGDDTQTGAQLSAVLARFASPAAAGPLREHADLLASTCAHDDLDAIVSAIARIDARDDRWLQSAQATLAAGAPGSARLGFELQRHAATLSLAETFRLEFIVALHCAAHGDFAEGIRALLIDKDRTPHWQPATLAAASAAWAAPFFTPPHWPRGQHPLADLS
jgi:enoyl-CoA hydratase/carnithine racemase